MSITFKTKHKQTKKQKETKEMAVFINEIQDCLEVLKNGRDFVRHYTYINLPDFLLKRAQKKYNRMVLKSLESLESKK